MRSWTIEKRDSLLISDYVRVWNKSSLKLCDQKGEEKKKGKNKKNRANESSEYLETFY